jgi:hypothetical protein
VGTIRTNDWIEVVEPGRQPLTHEAEMAKVLVLYYSSYGHIETMAYAVAGGAVAHSHIDQQEGGRSQVVKG